MPTTYLNSKHVPHVYPYTLFSLSDKVESAKVRVYKGISPNDGGTIADAELIATYYHNYETKTQGFFGTTYYHYGFNLNPQAILKTMVGPLRGNRKKSIAFQDLNALTGNTFLNCIDFASDYFLGVTFMQADADGILSEVFYNGSDVLYFNTFAVLASAEQPLNRELLSAYRTKALTRRTTTRTVADDENLYLSFCNSLDGTPQSNAVKFTAYDNTNTLLGSKTVLLGGGVTQINSIFSAACGLPQLKSMLALGGLDYNFNNASVHSWTVEGVLYDTFLGTTSTQTGVLATFTRSGQTTCDESIRLHWLNDLGGVDSYTFDNPVKAQSVKSKQARTSLGNSYLSHDRGGFKVGITSQDEIEISTKVNRSVFEWLRYLFASAEIYEERGGTFYAVSIDDARTVYSRKGLIELKFKLKYSVLNHADNV